jgi:hypothetical protein
LIDPRTITGNNKLSNELAEKIRQDPEKYIYGLQQIGGPGEARGGFGMDLNGDGSYDVYDGLFNTGVIGHYDADGKFIPEHENIGGPGTILIPTYDNYPWSWMRSSLFDADFIKLREIAISYNLPMKKVLNNINFSLYSRNIMLWTKAKINVDPENAFQPVQNNDGTTMFQQGVERYNVNPWTIPVGIKLTCTFK